MNIDEEKKLIVDKILNTNDKNLIAKVTRLIAKEQTSTYWTKLTAELRAELELNKQAKAFELYKQQNKVGHDTSESLKRYSGTTLS